MRHFSQHVKQNCSIPANRYNPSTLWDMAEETTGDRVYQVRRALGPDARHELSQRAFADLLNRAARKARVDLSFTDSTITRIEKNERRLQLDEAELIASVDPLQRGKVWLAFGPIVEDEERKVNG